MLVAGRAGGQVPEECRLGGVDGTVLCATVTVPLDHGDPAGRTLDLHVVILPAVTGPAESDPVFFLAGGPGQAATDMVPWIARGRRGPWAARDLVFMDQRGTGESSSIQCPAPPTIAVAFEGLHPPDADLARCLESVSAWTDVRFYTTTQAAHDLDAVRRALGYSTINLDGGSYGTRLALEYLRRYPRRVRTLQLNGAVPPDFRAPLHYATYAQAALDRLFDDCRRDAACAGAFPDLEDLWLELLDRLRRSPARVEVRAGDEAPLETVTYDADDLAYTVRSMLYGADGLELPRMIHAAHRTGDVTPFARTYARRAAGLGRQLSRGLHLSVLCAEDVQFITDLEAARATTGTDLGDYIIREYRRACEGWPGGEIPFDFHDPVTVDRPVLIISGLRDPSTPADTGDRVAAALPDAVHLVHRYGGHGFPGTPDVDCEARARETFLARGETSGLDLSCAAAERPAPFAIEAEAADDAGGARLRPGAGHTGESVAETAAPLALPRLPSPIDLDGRLDEAAWHGVAALPLVALEPVAGLEPSEPTDVRVGYDDEHIYLGAYLRTSHPDGPLVNTYTRDRWADDDVIELVLDTYNDNESGVIFTVNAVGNRVDAQVSNDAEFTYGFPINYSWNAFWDVATARQPDGWSVEMRIPFSSLRFQAAGDSVVMGMIVNRYIARNNESVTFPEIAPRWSFGVNKPSQARDVVLTGVRPTRPVYVSPYLLTGFERRWQSESPEGFLHADGSSGELGGDLRFALTDNLNVDLTANTDFAQVEADDQQVNLTRFSLFFPEKRQFFQERAGIFQFRTGQNNRLFHSRRIGIVEGETARILGGGRLVGRVGDWDIGVLDMQTGATDRAPGENFGVLRARRRVLNDLSYVGAMVTSRAGGEAHNLAYGLDGSVNLGDTRNLTLNWAQSMEDGRGGWASSTARVLLEDRDRRGLGYQIAFGRTGEGYDPGVGFVQRLDYREVSGRLTWGIFAGEDSALRRAGPRIEWTYLDRASNGALETAELSTGWELELQSGAMINGGFVVTRERLDRGFQLDGGVDVPAGRYDFPWGRIFARTAQAGALTGSFLGQAGRFFDGTILSGTLSPRWRISPRLDLGLELERTRIRFDRRDQVLDASVLRLRTAASASTHLSADAFVQYNSVERALLGNVRVRYNFSEGRDLWIVFNETRNTGRDGERVALPPVGSRTLLIKYVHTFDFS